MKLNEVPNSPAYLVFHDGFDGSMDVWPKQSIIEAESLASIKQGRLDSMGFEEWGVWGAYVKLPHMKVRKYHSV